MSFRLIFEKKTFQFSFRIIHSFFLLFDFLIHFWFFKNKIIRTNSVQKMLHFGNLSVSSEPLTKRRGRPCAQERLNNELLEQHFNLLIKATADNQRERCGVIGDGGDQLMLDDTRIIPFVVKRQRRVKANVREKHRMQTLNEALEVLKQHLPPEWSLPVTTTLSSASNDHSNSSRNSSICGGNAKLTKIDTLRLATSYIQTLSELIRQDDESRLVMSSTMSHCSNPQTNINASSGTRCYTPPTGSTNSSSSSPNCATSALTTYSSMQHFDAPAAQVKSEPISQSSVFHDKRSLSSTSSSSSSSSSSSTAPASATLIQPNFSQPSSRHNNDNTCYYSPLAGSPFGSNFQQLSSTYHYPSRPSNCVDLPLPQSMQLPSCNYGYTSCATSSCHCHTNSSYNSNINNSNSSGTYSINSYNHNDNILNNNNSSSNINNNNNINCINNNLGCNNQLLFSFIQQQQQPNHIQADRVHYSAY